MSAPFVMVSSISGRTFLARILRPGDAYGLNDSLSWGEDAGRGVTDAVARAAIHADLSRRLGVEFYDATKISESHPTGQFVSRYYLSTLLRSTSGLVLQGDVPEWQIDAESMAAFRDWAIGQV
jgi:hypothetical protein